jgi:hypothetical protein
VATGVQCDSFPDQGKQITIRKLRIKIEWIKICLRRSRLTRQWDCRRIQSVATRQITRGTGDAIDAALQSGFDPLRCSMTNGSAAKRISLPPFLGVGPGNDVREEGARRLKISHNVGAQDEVRPGVDWPNKRFRGLARDRSEKAMWRRERSWGNGFKVLRIAATFLGVEFAIRRDSSVQIRRHRTRGSIARAALRVFNTTFNTK